MDEGMESPVTASRIAPWQREADDSYRQADAARWETSSPPPEPCRMARFFCWSTRPLWLTGEYNDAEMDPDRGRRRHRLDAAIRHAGLRAAADADDFPGG